ncbi:MAG: aminoacyl-histidine dipeptidase [Bacteroidales bacterium]|nr:aminoacyl-histidine dipeptidase [Bacteroidales bacterium]
MSKDILNLSPAPLWNYFYELTQIPRPSKHEAAVVQYMKRFGEGLGLETIVDEVGNVIIRKPATPGLESRKGIILQGHVDMVPQANSDTGHNFETDPIQPWVDGEWVKAKGTTLGADNGIGVAAAMALLASKDIPHGPLEALFTIDEETGMTGANALKPGLLKGEILINLDSEDEGELYVGCAGGTNANIRIDYRNEKVGEGLVPMQLAVTGLKGGHSGMDIILERGNSNKILFRFLFQVTEKYGLRLASINGGSLRNAIPRESFATILVPKKSVDALKSELSEFQAIVKSELASADPGVTVALEPADRPETVIDTDAASRIIRAVYGCPNGVMRMSTDMPGLVETSTNLAIVKSEGDHVFVKCLLRSSVDSAKADLENMFTSVFTLAGAEVVFDGQYPGWKPNMDSWILKRAQEVYQQDFGKIPEIKAIHAGLECGILGGAYPHWDMISFGPTIRFPHSPDEKVNIKTVDKFWNFLKAIVG